MAMIGAVALIVIGPEKLPGVARTVGTLLGRAQRYVADVKAEVNQAMDIDELKKMKETVESAGRDVEKSIHEAQSDINKDWHEVADELKSLELEPDDAGDFSSSRQVVQPPPQYHHPDKNWRLKRGATPQWFKSRQRVRRHVQSGAARVARHRPNKLRR